MAAVIPALAVMSCNNSVFVTDFSPDSVDIKLNGAGEQQAVKFSSEKWERLIVQTAEGSDSYRFTVTPLGDESAGFEGNELRGDGSIEVSNAITKLIVTRHGSVVTIDLNYALGNSESVFFLTAANDEWAEAYTITLTVEPDTAALRIDSLNYGELNSWGVDGNPVWRQMPGSMANASDETVTYNWAPDSLLLPMGVNTTSDDYLLLRALAGRSIEIPARDDNGLTWTLSPGQTATLPFDGEVPVYALRDVPPLPPIVIEPHKKCRIWMKTETVTFTPTMTVTNTITGESTEMILWVKFVVPVSKYDDEEVYRIEMTDI